MDDHKRKLFIRKLERLGSQRVREKLQFSPQLKSSLSDQYGFSHEENPIAASWLEEEGINVARRANRIAHIALWLAGFSVLLSLLGLLIKNGSGRVG